MTRAVGVIMPSVDLERLPGDVGHPDSFSYPVLFRTSEEVTGARQMVTDQLSATILDSYLNAALKLQESGATVITTTCGFLSVIQKELAPRLDVPFVASSLLQIPLIYALTRQPIGIITADESVLCDMHLDAAGVNDIPLVISGLQDFEAFSAPFLNHSRQIDFEKVTCAIESVAMDAVRRHPDIGAFVLECHNLGPWAASVRWVTQRPVFDIVSFVEMIANSTIERSEAGSTYVPHQHNLDRSI